jgi:hypothetical protein
MGDGSYQKPKPEDVAQVCLNGHLIVGSIKRYPQFCKAFCEECGTRTIDRCEKCSWPIAGPSPYGWMADSGPFRPPKFCGECGNPFPWTATALASAKEYTDELDTLSADEKTSLKTTIDELTVDNPATPVAAERFKKFIAKVGPAAGSVLQSIITTIASQEAKKWLGLP